MKITLNNLINKLVLVPLILIMTACGGDDNKTSGENTVDQVTEASGDNDSINTAQSISTTSSLSGVIDGIDDFSDYYAIELNRLDQVLISLTGNSGSDLDLYLINPAIGNVALSQNLDSNEYIDFTAAETTTYYIHVASENNSPSNYRLTVEIADPMNSDEFEGSGCIETRSNGSNYYQEFDGRSDFATALLPGQCNPELYVSKCDLDYGTMQTTTYYDAIFVQQAGGHAYLETEGCNAIDSGEVSASYTVL